LARNWLASFCLPLDSFLLAGASRSSSLNMPVREK
jgi:hypothetical protein